MKNVVNEYENTGIKHIVSETTRTDQWVNL
jgi:hypothetical protein